MPVAPRIWTIRDAVDAITDVFEFKREARHGRNARRALDAALRRIANESNFWSYLNRSTVIATVAYQTEGTIEYDHTGGAYERMVTLTDSTFPEWARYGRLKIGDAIYDVEDRKSSTIVTLTEISNPGDDVAAETSYSLWRDEFPLPVNYRKAGELVDTDSNFPLEFISPDEAHLDSGIWVSPQQPSWYTIRGSRTHPGRMSLIFGPPPEAIRSYELQYASMPRQMVMSDYLTGSASVASGGTTVTISGGTLPTGIEGAVIRLAASGVIPPTSIYGRSDDQGDDQLIASGLEGYVRNRLSDTTLELHEASAVTLSGVGYVISDPLDVNQGAMLDAVLRIAEADYARATARDGKEIASREVIAAQALRLAMQADAQSRAAASASGGSGSGSPSLTDIMSNSQEAV